MKRVVRFYETGGPEVLCLEAAEPDALRDGEVLLRVQAIGLNNSEAQYRRGVYPMKETVFPTRLGRECSGVVVALGPGVAGFEAGEEVSTIPAFDIQRSGVYGEWAIVPALALVRTPAALSRVQAAAVWQQYLTAYGPLVEFSRLEAGDWVLVTAASSSVGRGAMQIARQLGCRVIATTRHADKAAGLRAGGADRVVVTGRDPLVDSVLEATGGAGVRVAIDPIAGPQLRELCEATAREGTVFLYGQLSTEPVDFPLVTCMAKALSVRGYTLWELTLDPERRERAVRWINERLADGRLVPAIDRVFALEQIVQAHRYLESGQQSGKIVVTV